MWRWYRLKQVLQEEDGIGVVEVILILVVLIGLVLIFKNIVSRVYKKELAFFYGVAAAAVIFDLIFMRIFSRVEVGIIDFLVIGTVMDMLLDVIFVVLTLRESRYVRIKMGADH